MTTPALIPTFTIHCFFAGTCNHTVQYTDPHTGSRWMQTHYNENHRDDLTRLGYPPVAPSTGGAA